MKIQCQSFVDIRNYKLQMKVGLQMSFQYVYPSLCKTYNSVDFFTRVRSHGSLPMITSAKTFPTNAALMSITRFLHLPFGKWVTLLSSIFPLLRKALLQNGQGFSPLCICYVLLDCSFMEPDSDVPAIDSQSITKSFLVVPYSLRLQKAGSRILKGSRSV